MGKLSRRKGSAFERVVARQLAKAWGVTPKQIFRTPLSGGHPYGDKGDLTIDPSIGFLFGSVECKHRRTWALQQVLPLHGSVKAWLRQASRANANFLLVVRGNRTPIYAFMVERGWLGLGVADDEYAHVVLPWNGGKVYGLLFRDLLQILAQ